MHTASTNVDAREISKFDALASRWWDPEGEFRALHQINPLRLGYIDKFAALSGKRVVDIGCGGGLLAEAMAGLGAEVTGIDMAESPLQVARLHLHESGLQVDYRLDSAENLAASMPACFDVVTCMEMLEHVPDPAAVVRACAALAKPGGQVFFSTLNRNPKSFLLAVLAAEYLLHLTPRGTHEYAKFIRPSELDDWARQAGLALVDTAGLHYNPLTRQCWIDEHPEVNYLMHFTRAC
ncbi:MAG: bifunctional 2-polyprenyl-6-hydroxyphenol methylase/3-demethylubiquinol 3-O-methyltransferase UbiG [Gammaproteobacteria bacterium]|nr:bifunctional 2-polyprenyl-6-hydroxyphenol methylase/3-demethylubiquinol 3-O-methyltransferase UbiG [Gammaproteobacteria bacterium]MDE2345879.1 bifunctional 2-polyprenyl-6-hydroxyphenol methylase/3-demethylubiquinol 3-O-methyltransferase UbiG [Gammaproteobacteria bacterium]